MRAHFTKILNKWKQELMQEVDRTVDHMKDEAANFPDPADRASQEEEFALELRARDRERKLIKKIDKTLQLIEDEEYGWCESCGIEIGVADWKPVRPPTCASTARNWRKSRKNRSASNRRTERTGVRTLHFCFCIYIFQ
jgi:RNA polymerase-binding protein DksA